MSPKFDGSQEESQPSSGPKSGHYFVGVDIGGTSLRVALADASGSTVARWSASTVGVNNPQTVVSMIVAGVDQLLLETLIPRSSLRALAAGAPGVTNVDAGIVNATSYLKGWRNVPLRTLLEDAFQLPVAIDNDVNLAATGEGWKGAAKGQSDFVFIAIGTGVGAGIMLNGQLLRGRGWVAGEVGYMLVPGTSVAPVADDEPGALESFLGGEGIRNRWQSAWSEAVTRLPRTMIATDVFDYAIQGDALAKSILNKSALVLAYAIYNISLILNCPHFVLGGSVGMHAALCSATQAVLDERRAQVNPDLVRSQLGADAQITGAIRLAMQVAGAKPVPNPRG